MVRSLCIIQPAEDIRRGCDLYVFSTDSSCCTIRSITRPLYFKTVPSVWSNAFVIGMTLLSVIRWVECTKNVHPNKAARPETRSTLTSRDDGCYTHGRFRGKVIKTQLPLQRQVVRAL